MGRGHHGEGTSWGGGTYMDVTPWGDNTMGRGSHGEGTSWGGDTHLEVTPPMGKGPMWR